MTSTLASIATTRVSPTRMRGAHRARLGFAVNPRRSVRTGHSVVPRTVASGSRKEINVDRLVKLDDSFSLANANSKHAPAPGAARYHVTFITGEKMGSGLSAPDAGVQLMLIAEGTYLHFPNPTHTVCAYETDTFFYESQTAGRVWNAWTGTPTFAATKGSRCLSPIQDTVYSPSVTV